MERELNLGQFSRKCYGVSGCVAPWAVGALNHVELVQVSVEECGSNPQAGGDCVQGLVGAMNLLRGVSAYQRTDGEELKSNFLQ